MAGTHASGVVIKNESVVQDIRISKEAAERGHFRPKGIERNQNPDGHNGDPQGV
jgi:hypothetical protein